MRRYRIPARRSLLVLVLASLVVLAAACGESLEEAGDPPQAETTAPPDSVATTMADEEADDPSGDGIDRGDWPDSVIYGMLPTEDAQDQLQLHEPLEAYMTSCLDHPFELFQSTSYAAAIEAMRTGNAHIARFGPFSYIIANERAGAEAFVQGVSDPDEPFYQSVFITLESSGVGSLEDLEGEDFAFVEPSSTSGYLFPRSHMISSLGVSDDDLDDWLGEVVFSGGHDASVFSVLNGDVTAAAVSSNHWLTHVEEPESDLYTEHDNFESLLEIDRTGDIPRSLESYAPDLPDSLKQELQRCFGEAHEESTLDEYMTDYNYAQFIPVDDSAYDIIRQTAEGLGLSPEELLEE